MTDELVDRNIRRQSGSTHSLTWFERAVGKVYGLLGAPERLCMAPGCAGHMTSCSRRNVPRSAMRDGVLTVLATYSPHRSSRTSLSLTPNAVASARTLTPDAVTIRIPSAGPVASTPRASPEL